MHPSGGARGSSTRRSGGEKNSTSEACDLLTGKFPRALRCELKEISETAWLAAKMKEDGSTDCIVSFSLALASCCYWEVSRYLRESTSTSRACCVVELSHRQRGELVTSSSLPPSLPPPHDLRARSLRSSKSRLITWNPLLLFLISSRSSGLKLIMILAATLAFGVSRCRTSLFLLSS